MKPIVRALIIAVLHLAIIASLGAKLLYDRATRPRVWVQTANYDPDLPIRGRYVALRPMVRLVPEPAPGADANTKMPSVYARFEVRDGELVAIPDKNGDTLVWLDVDQHGEVTVRTIAPMLYFLPEHAKDPTRLERSQELWAEVTIPKKGPPRPIRLGIKQNGVLTPLDLR